MARKVKTNLKGGSIGSVIATLLGLIIFIGLIYFLYKYFTKYDTNKVLKKYLIDTDLYNINKNQTIIHQENLPPTNRGNQYNINFWIYISNIGTTNKVLISRESNNGVNPEVSLEAKTNNLLVSITTLINNPNNPELMTTISPIDQKRIDNIKIQTWVNINIAMNDNALDVFINGKLRNSYLLQGPISIASGDIKICPTSTSNFQGYLSKVSYSNSEYDIDTLYSTYLEGPSSNTTIKTGITSWFNNFNIFKNSN